MKKLLISILAILLIVLVYLLMFKNITVFGWESKNFTDLKDANEELNSKTKIAKQTSDQEYPAAIDSLENAITALKQTKNIYEKKTQYYKENAELGVVNIKQYKIERLWATLGNYAKDCEVELVLDLSESNDSSREPGGARLYDLNITLVGSYIGITDFIYKIEKDDTLNFRILNFKMVPNEIASITIENEDGKSSTTYEIVKNLQATFRIENVGIDLQ